MTRLSQAVEALYESSFLGRFPYDDCFALQRQNPSLSHAIVPDLDMYWSFIAGYASSATRLEIRAPQELRNAIPRLMRSFFEVHPEYKPFQEDIRSENVNALWRELQVRDSLRRDPVTLMEEVLGRSSAGGQI